MKATKTFDCVEMKNAVQAKLREEKQRLGEAEVMRRHHLWLETSEDPLARWWRSLPRPKSPQHTAEPLRS
jgi:hypothetical protein